MKTDFTWDSMDYWKCGEWQVVQERLDDRDKEGTLYCPRRECLFAALDAVDFTDVRVAWFLQDPYPTGNYATGVALSVPKSCTIPSIPPTLKIVFDELVSDLEVPFPITGNLTKWTKQGVLLWNVIPSCLYSQSLSDNWPEYKLLSEEITRRLSEKGVDFILSGAWARQYKSLIDEEINTVFLTSHPSPRGNMNSTMPFKGSKIFSKVNASLKEDFGEEPIDWSLS